MASLVYEEPVQHDNTTIDKGNNGDITTYGSSQSALDLFLARTDQDIAASRIA